MFPGNAKKWEGMNPTLPNEPPLWEVGVSMDSQIFRGRLQGSKLIGLKCFIYD
jgi:hypothetical protein